MSTATFLIGNSAIVGCAFNALNLARLPVPPRPLAVVAEGESVAKSDVPSTGLGGKTRGGAVGSGAVARGEGRGARGKG